MSFHYPNSFFLFIPWLILIAIFSWDRWKRRKEIQELGDWRLIKQLVPVEAFPRRKKKDFLSLVGLFFIIFAACGPQFGATLKEVKHRGADIFIAVDTSRSMLAEDVAPSRIERAKQSLSLLIKRLEGNRVGIIAFAKYAVIQCPMTVDNDAARMFLDILDTNTVSKQGTSIGDAIRLALQSFNKDDKTGKAIVLITDGEDHESDPIGAAKLAKEKGVVIFLVGIGTTKGEVIKQRDDQGKVTEFLKYKGEMVLSRLDDSLLSKIADITGGRHYRASSTDKEIDEIADILNSYDKKEFSTKTYQRLEDQYHWFALIGFLLLLIEFFISEKPRQRDRIKQMLIQAGHRPASLEKIGALILLILFSFTSLSNADVKSHVLKGNQLFLKKDFVGARGEFESAQIDAPEAAFLPYNIAATYLVEGNFEEAQKKYDEALKMTNDPDLKSKIAYNVGYMTFAKGDRAGSIEKFKEALRLNPKDMDAKYNIEYIRAGKNPKQPFQPQKQNQKNDGDKNQQQNQEKKDGGENKDNGQQPKDEQKKEGELSQEDAERVLQMMSEQEKEKMRALKPLPAGSPSKKEEEKESENW